MSEKDKSQLNQNSVQGMADGDVDSSKELDENALFYHEYPTPGKVAIEATKPLGNQRDLALAYSPGVAAPCLRIAENPADAAKYTSRANMVAVITNGTAVLGLGPIGALASKPVMEGKAVLFKKFADVDSIDLEVEELDVDKFCDIVAALEPTFGGVNLEDIKAPECFAIEEQLRKRMNVPVFHDDQHGTAIIVAAAILNGLELAGKKLESSKIIASGAGAASIACLNLLVSLGAKRENITVSDASGVVWKGRNKSMDPYKEAYAQDTDARELGDVIEGADVFLGLSAANVLKPEMVKKMADTPMILALANPNPEIKPERAREVRPDALICTGRSDYPNQVNNVLCFPYIFRGALDVGATTINEEMKMAAVRAIAGLAREASSDVAAQAYGDVEMTFGPNYLIPFPFDQRLILRIAPEVAKAAMDSGVATRPIEDFDAYRDKLNRFVFRSGMVMKPIVAAAKQAQKRVVFADGEDERVLRAAQVLLEDGIAQPILIGRPDVIETRLKRFALPIRPNEDFEVINPLSDPRYREYVELYMELAGRDGMTPDAAARMVRTNATVIAGLAVKRGEADALICGLEGRYISNVNHIRQIIGQSNEVRDLSTLSLLISQKGAHFFTDSYVTENPSVAELVEMTGLAAQTISRFGITPKVALLSYSNFGSRPTKSSRKMREAADVLIRTKPDLMVDGEMHADSALSVALRNRVNPNSHLKEEEANLFVFPNLDAANISLNMVKIMSDALHVGPILLGTNMPAHVLTPSITSRGVVNMSAIAAVQAAQQSEQAVTS
jgi:malate dehydrogenase (oxaloacetate-decarboxylating)(NADP+)